MPALLILIITFLSCFLIASMPALTFILAIVWGATMISAAFYLKRVQIIVIFVLNLALLYGLAGISNLVFYLAFFAVAALVMSIMLSCNREYYELQQWGVVSAVLCISLFLGLIYLINGDIGVNQMEQQLNKYFHDSIKAYEDSGLMELYEKQGTTRAEVEKTFKQVASGIARHLPAFYYLQAIMAVFFMLLTAIYINLKLKIQRLKKKPYIREIMPWPLVWMAIAGLGLWLLGRDEMSSTYYIGSNILAVMAPITIYFGLSVVGFKIKELRAGKKKWTIGALAVLTIVFPLSAVIFFCLVGLFDSLLDFRHLHAE